MLKFYDLCKIGNYIGCIRWEKEHHFFERVILAISELSPNQLLTKNSQKSALEHPVANILEDSGSRLASALILRMFRSVSEYWEKILFCLETNQIVSDYWL